MDLKTYISSIPYGERSVELERIAKCLSKFTGRKQLSPITMRSYANGNREMPPEYGDAIEQATNGGVKRADQWPDIPWVRSAEVA